MLAVVIAFTPGHHDDAVAAAARRGAERPAVASKNRASARARACERKVRVRDRGANHLSSRARAPSNGV